MAPLHPQTPPNLADRGLELRQSYLKHPGEVPEVDYKDGIKFNAGDDFSLKLAKHILGMANAGGGHIVLGYKENAAKHPEALASLPAEVLASYDVSVLASFVEKYKAGSEKISLVIHKDKHPDNAVTYPIIEVHGFKERPFFCKSSAGNGILQEGALYIRIASARTVKIASPDDWDQLISLCVEKKQDSLLKRFHALLREVGAGSPAVTPESRGGSNKIWIEQNRSEFEEILKKNDLNDAPFLEGTHFLTLPVRTWNAPDLLEAARKSSLRNTGWPIGIALQRDGLGPQPTGDGIKSIIPNRETTDFWYLKNEGSYYFARTVEEARADRSRVRYPPRPNPILYFDTRIWRIAEFLLHCATLYRNLGVDPSATVRIDINHHRIRGRELDASDSRRLMWSSPISAVDKSTWGREVSLDFLTTGISDLTKEASRNLFELFDFWNPEEGVLDSVINEFMQSRV